jgi:hypothetical protein
VGLSLPVLGTLGLADAQPRRLAVTPMGFRKPDERLLSRGLESGGDFYVASVASQTVPRFPASARKVFRAFR